MPLLRRLVRSQFVPSDEAPVNATAVLVSFSFQRVYAAERTAAPAAVWVRPKFLVAR